MARWFLLFFLISFSSSSLIAQRELIDSLQKILPSISNPTKEVFILNDIAWSYQGIDNDSMYHYAYKALTIGEALACHDGIIDAMGILGNYYFLHSEYPKALYWFNKQKTKSTEQDHQKGIAIALGSIGSVYIEKTEYSKALQYYLESMEINKRIGNELDVATCLANIGSLYHYLKEYDKSIRISQEAAQTYLGLNDSISYITMQMNIGVIYSLKKMYKEAETYYSKVIEYIENGGHFYKFSNVYLNLAVNYEECGQAQKAETYYDLGINIAERLGSKRMLAKLKFNKAKFFQAQKKHEEAIAIVESGLTILDDIENPFILERMAYSVLYEVYKNEKKYKEAFINLEKLKTVEGILFTATKEQQVQNLKIKYETTQKMDSITILQTKELVSKTIIQKQEIISKYMATALFLLLGGIGLLVYLFRLKRNQQIELQKKNQELFEKNIQINHSNQLLEEKKNMIETLNEELSHRVKNNLQFISSLMRMQARRLKNPEAKAAVNEAENRVEAMSLVHRRLYNNQENRTIEMYDYLKQLSNHLLNSFALKNKDPIVNLDLKRLRMKAESAVHIGLIINELMTNSFKYAFVEQQQPIILIELKQINNERIKLLYKDNGKGMPIPFDLTENDSLGLRLIHDLTTEQLNGKVDIQNQDGAQFYFEFRDLKLTS